MPFKLPEFTRETTTTTTGAYVMGGAPAGYFPVSSSLADGDTTLYSVYLAGTPAFVDYFGTYNLAGNSLSRDVVISSSNGDADISPFSGTKNVIIGMQGRPIRTLIDLLRSGSTGGLELVTGSPLPTFAAYTVSSFAKTLLDDVSNLVARQTLDALENVLDAVGDMIYCSTDAGDIPARLAIGSANQYLRVVSGLPAWVTLLAAHSAYSSAVSPLTATDVEAALDQIGGFFAAGFYKSAASGDRAIPSGAPWTDTWAHGLAVLPKLVVARLKCSTNDGTYVTGDLLELATSIGNSSTGPTGINIRADATNVYLDKAVNAANTIRIISKGGGAAETITETSWRYNFYTYA